MNSVPRTVFTDSASSSALCAAFVAFCRQVREQGIRSGAVTCLPARRSSLTCLREGAEAAAQGKYTLLLRSAPILLHRLVLRHLHLRNTPLQLATLL